jgi:hypothetical protein
MKMAIAPPVAGFAGTLGFITAGMMQYQKGGENET